MLALFAFASLIVSCIVLKIFEGTLHGFAISSLVNALIAWPTVRLRVINTGPDSLVDKASASGVGGQRFNSQCRRHWGSF